jgi:hypothetical protein
MKGEVRGYKYPPPKTSRYYCAGNVIIGTSDNHWKLKQRGVF